MEAMARDLQEILRISAEQKRLWDAYEGRYGLNIEINIFN